VGGDRNFKFGRSVDHSKMTNHPWKGRGQVTWTI